MAATRRAWDVCGHARRPGRLDPELLLLALAHAVHTRAFDAPPEARAQEEVVVAARLVAALQLKLQRREVGGHRMHRLDQLLPHLPTVLQRALRDRIAKLDATTRTRRAKPRQQAPIPPR